MKTISTLPELLSFYGEIQPRSRWKEINYINEDYRKFIEKSPFLVLATSGEKGIDCSPRGDPPGFVRVVDEKHIQIPDRKGNNRLDSLRNIIFNPNIGVIFIIPGVGETIRLSGCAKIVIDKELCESFSINEKPASSVIAIKVEKIYFQCQKAFVRSHFWEAKSYLDRNELPSTGEMIKRLSISHGVEFDSEEYDKNYPENMKKTIY